jgi:hypothetical protein
MSSKETIFFAVPDVLQKSELTTLARERGAQIAYTLSAQVSRVVLGDDEPHTGGDAAQRSKAIEFARKYRIAIFSAAEFRRWLEQIESGDSFEHTTTNTTNTNTNNNSNNSHNSNNNDVAIQRPLRAAIKSVPIINCLVPNQCPTSGVHRIGVFGSNFKASRKLQLRFGAGVVVRHVEFHCESALLVTLSLPAGTVLPQTVDVAASNDAGVHYGPSVQFAFVNKFGDEMPALSNSLGDDAAVLGSRLANLQRSVAALLSGAARIQREEEELRRYIDLATLGHAQASLALPAPTLTAQSHFSLPHGSAATAATAAPISMASISSSYVTFPTPPVGGALTSTSSNLSSLPYRSRARGSLAYSAGTASGAGANAAASSGDVPATSASGPIASPYDDIPAPTKKKALSSVENDARSAAAAMAGASVVGGTLEDRELRVFISSPFRDMVHERDLVVKHVIPRLRKLCSVRDVLLSVVDLRWGVTDSMSEQAATLLVCLKEVEKCNVFIGMYGERYGLSQSAEALKGMPTKEDDLVKRTLLTAAKTYPWIGDLLDRSMTELEMRMVLEERHAAPRKACWFYMRDPYFAETLEASERELYRSESAASQQRLDRLKRDIAAHKVFPTRQYERPDVLAELVSADLEALLDSRFPPNAPLAKEDSERFRHQAMAASLMRVWLADRGLLSAIDRFVKFGSPDASSAAAGDVVHSVPMCVVGDSGVGVSALLANWADLYRTDHPEQLVVTHFVGCTSDSTSVPLMMRRLLHEVECVLPNRADAAVVVPTDDSEFVQSLPRLLERVLRTNARSRLVLVIDGVDNLDESASAKALSLVWLARQWPPTIRVLLSARTGLQPHREIVRRQYPVIQVQPLDEERRIELIRRVLAPPEQAPERGAGVAHRRVPADRQSALPAHAARRHCRVGPLRVARRAHRRRPQGAQHRRALRAAAGAHRERLRRRRQGAAGRREERGARVHHDDLGGAQGRARRQRARADAGGARL